MAGRGWGRGGWVVGVFAGVVGCSSESPERPSVPVPAVVVRSKALAGLHWIRDEAPTAVAQRTLRPTSTRPGAVIGVGVRLSTDAPGVWVDVESTPAAAPARVTTHWSLAESPTTSVLWAWSDHAIESLHWSDSTTPPELRLRLGPGLVAVAVADDRLWISDASGRAQLQTSTPWVEDAQKTRRPVHPRVRRDGDAWLVTLGFDATGLVPPLVVDPAWTTIPAMNRARASGPMIALADGRVVAVSGDLEGASTFEVYNPATNVWTLRTPPGFQSYAGGSRAVLLSSGKILTLGAYGVAAAQVIDASTGTVTDTGPMASLHEYSALVAFADGSALVAGGSGKGGTVPANAVAELYRPATNDFVAVPSLSTSRNDGLGIRRADGHALVVGGAAAPGAWLSTSEVFDPTTKTWAAGPSLGAGLGNMHVAALSDGRWLLAGKNGAGASALHLLGASGTSFTSVPFTGVGAHYQLVPLPSGRAAVLDTCGPSTCAKAWTVFDGTASVPLEANVEPRRDDAMTAPLPGGKVLVVGGNGLDAPLSSAEVFAPLPVGAACTASGACAGLACVDGVCCGTASCAPTEQCNGAASKGTCRSKNGVACTSGASCASGVCVDGVCCDRACAGQCEACDVAGSVGTCVGVAGAPHGSRPACTASPTACGLTCNGSDAAACHLASATTPCSADKCAAGVETHARLCDGAGKCLDTGKACGAYACGKTTCLTACATNADCTAGYACKGTTCAPQEGLGKACKAGAECASGACVDGVCCSAAGCELGSVCNLAGKEGTCRKALGATCKVDAECGEGSCVDGVCCDGACAGQCEACNLPGKEGRCTAVVGAPMGARTPCAKGAGACEARVCDGKDRAACQGFASGKETECGKGRCEGDGWIAPSRCDGAGACVTPVKTACTPFVCGATGCLVTCEGDGQCLAGFRCSSGRCLDAAARCTTDRASSQAKDGRTILCAPYLCDDASGLCRKGCLASEECSAGFACAVGQCLPVDTTPPESDGGCSTGGGRGAPGWPVLLLAGALVRRRRRTTLALLIPVLPLALGCRGSSVETSLDVPDAGSATKGFSTVAAGGPTTQSLGAVVEGDGNVLVFGTGPGSTSTVVQRYTVASATFSNAGNLLVARSTPLVARLASGKVLVAGGRGSSGTILKSTEIFDPATGTSTAGPNLTRGMLAPGAITLSSGDVLLDGQDGSGSTNLDRYRPATGTITPTASLGVLRDGAAFVELSPTKVLVVPVDGGVPDNHGHLYDPTTDTWKMVGSLVGPRQDARVAPLPGGKALVFGASTSWSHSDRGEVFDPVTETFVPTASLGARVWRPALLPLPSGRVLVASGYGYSLTPRGESAVYDPVSGTFIAAGPMAYPRAWEAYVRLPDGRALFVGDDEHVEIFAEGGLGAVCVAAGDCANLRCVDGVCCGTASCPSGQTCAGVTAGTCKPALGAACTTGTGCASGFCVDGVCCDSACAGQCAACNVVGKVGRCSAVAGPPRGGRPACSGAGLGTTCGATCDGVVTATCSFAPTGTACGADACADGIETKKSTCNGAGLCGDTSLACAPFRCGATACKTTCTSAADCAAGAYCKGGACLPIEGLGQPCGAAGDCASGHCVDGVCCATECAAGTACNVAPRKGTCSRANGATCAAGAECASGHCIDGVCCDAACDGQCEACDVVGKAGTCTPVDGAPHPGRPLCPLGPDGPDAACAARQCLGAKDTKSCVGFVAAAGAPCAPATCSGAGYTAAASCDGAGKCVAPAVAACAPYACNAKGCLTKCAIDLDCAVGWLCRDATCVREGLSCTKDRSASVGKDGAVKPCAPYLCGTDGDCAKACATSDDCASGAACDVASHTCVSTQTSEASGCGLGRGDASSALVLAPLAALAAAVRRRRGRERSTSFGSDGRR